MFASLTRSRVRRRGVVLVVILGMLGLLALIGVTFATFSNQAQINARNFAAAQSFPDAAEMMDYALSQLIDDTANPQSVIRGHSITRDMYGNDAANNGALLDGFPDGSNSILLQSAAYVTTQPPTLPNNVYGSLIGTIKVVTNIPNNGNSSLFYGYDFRRWLIRTIPWTDTTNAATPVYYPSRSFEILADDPADASGSRAFYVAAASSADVTAGTAKMPGPDPTITGYTPAGFAGTWTSTLFSLNRLVTLAAAVGNTRPNPASLVLDGRFLRAFNGAGMAGMGLDGFGHPMTEYANFRYNGSILANILFGSSPSYTPSYNPSYGDPNQISGMDEDYDAADLENWFLSVQSADGQMVIPSFHRPSILTALDWTVLWNNTGTTAQQTYATRAMSKILRPRRIDGHSAISFPDLLPDATTGKISYDVDNDGDGTTDAVWLDLGYPPKRNAEGQLFKPLFAFSIIGLNGKLPLNTAGNLQSRIASASGAGAGLDTLVPEFDHTEHLGNSPSEIDMRYALQNAYDPNNPNAYSQIDNAGVTTAGTFTGGVFTAGDKPVNVALTQLRNLLTGTRAKDPTYDPNQVTGGTNVPTTNYDANWVVVNNRLVLLPNNVADAADLALVGASGVVTRGTHPVAGRWGEEANVPLTLAGPLGGNYIFNNVIRAGHSVARAGYDFRDDRFITFDPWPSPANGESADFYDVSGSLSLPVERVRRFVNPIDISGDGRITTFNAPAAGGRPRAHGGDPFGRVSFFRYFRPPGVPIAVTNRPSAYPFVTPGPLGNNPVYPNTPVNETNNPYHGYPSFMNPAVTAGISNGLLEAGMPADLPVPTAPPYPPNYPLTSAGGGNALTIPTYSAQVNSNWTVRDPNTGNPIVVGWSNSPGLNNADEMNLYAPSSLDSPFGPSDLEWLYRFQDVDGASLNSRLGQLAPISFLNPLDGARRRRLFALDTWETTNFVWSNDNPSGTFPNNSRFTQLGNASFFATNQLFVNNTPAPQDPAWDFSVQSQLATTLKYPLPTPTIAHRDRRINLNFPLPVSNDPAEPVRQKWIRESYQLLKAVLPPKAVDTPEELAQLSQYLVNLVDFRDPDATMTKFVNTDVVVTRAQPPVAGGPATYGTQATVQFSTVASQPTVFPAYDPRYTEANGGYLIQYGMEYQPVAINEVLAVQFQTKKTQANDTPLDSNYVTRFFVELVNVLTKDALATAPDTSDLDLAGWDFIVLPDANGVGRPDLYTGQVPTQVLNGLDINAYPLSGLPTGLVPFKSPAPKTGVPATPDAPVLAVPGMAPPIQALASAGATPDASSYYLFGNTATATAGGPELVNAAGVANQPVLSNAGTSTMFDTLVTKELAGKEGQYFWIYLRRPPNPFDTSYNPAFPNDNRVVVDSFRFFYGKEPLAKGVTQNAPPPTVDKQTAAPTGLLFSLQRMQPFRGGQGVPPLPGDRFTGVLPPKFVLTSYGFSEQTAVAPSSNTYGNYGTAATPDTVGPAGRRTTGMILNTLGARNNPTDVAWDYLTFHDRDFTSVAELLMVPGAPPGLFTKQFAEVPPPINDTSTGVAGSVPRNYTGVALDATANQWATSPWTAAGSAPLQFTATGRPHSNPYLIDEFFYTAASELAWPAPPAPNATTPAPYVSSDVTAAANYVGGPSGAGWHKMLEFFEVPSPAFGAIGQVADGSNYDWARQDLKPGLLNINLIVDEEVYLGLMGESFYGNPYNPLSRGALNQVQIGTGSAAALKTPAVVTQVDDNGKPTAFYYMPNLGCFDVFTDPADSFNYQGNAMKACFADFLKITHGSNGYIYGYGRDANGAYGQVDSASNQRGLSSSRPFHSLSYPDIDFTVMRPATIPPAPAVGAVPSLTNPVDSWVNGVPPAWNDATYPNVGYNSAYPGYSHDPGVKNPYLYTKSAPVQPPPIPARRLFQIPDWWGFGATQTPPSNAASQVNGSAYTGDPVVNTQTYDQNTGVGKLFNPKYDLTLVPNIAGTGPNVYLGGANVAGVPDQRDHPYFRSEMLQKVVNLTTVRTHQYAVWVTVGFFEVTRQGDPLLAGTSPGQAYDILGLELGVLSGRNVRYRGFFLVDRTKAIGFNPSTPGDFRNMVVYRQLIE